MAQNPSKKSKSIPPKKPFKALLATIIIAVCVGLIFAVKFIKTHSISPEQTSTSSRGKGNPQAAIKIVEFMDFQCPACARGALSLKDLFKDNGDKMYLQVKYYPLEKMHMHAIRAARYAECSARQGKFWPVHDALFERQNEWHELINPDNIFEEIVKKAGVDMNKLDVCLGNEEISDLILKDKQEGQALGVQSTPTYFVNGKMVVGINALEQELMSALGRVKQ